jgi:hypothetical protein
MASALRLPFHFLALLTALVAAAIPASAADAPGENKQLEAAWRPIAQRDPRLGSHTLFAYAFNCAAADRFPERVEAALTLAASMQDRNPSSPTYGNFRWHWADERAEDLNAVQFCMQRATLLWRLHRDRLTPKARQELERTLRLAVEGIRRHPVREGYTNIYLMKTGNLLALADCLKDRRLAADGASALRSWWDYTRTNGITEYMSPTYLGIDLDSLGLIACFASDPGSRDIAHSGIRLLWTDIAANWFEPAQRLGGARSRDYDYLTGRGYLHSHLLAARWSTETGSFPLDVPARLGAWRPPAGIKQRFTALLPRTVIRRWGPKPEQTAVHYVGRHFTIGSAGAGFGPEDKVFVVNFPGGRASVNGILVMDGRGDPYGVKREVTGGGHLKSHHLRPFVAGVQRGPEVLLVASDAAPVMVSGIRKTPTRCLLSHFVFPAEAEVWIGDKKMSPPAPGASTTVPENATVFLRVQDVALALRFVFTRDTDGRVAPVRWHHDGGRLNASRLSCVLSEGPPEARGTVAIWAKGAEGLDSAAFATFRREANALTPSVTMHGTVLDVTINNLRLENDVSKARRLRCEGGDTLVGPSPLQIQFPAGAVPRPWDTFLPGGSEPPHR